MDKTLPVQGDPQRDFLAILPTLKRLAVDKPEARKHRITLNYGIDRAALANYTHVIDYVILQKLLNKWVPGWNIDTILVDMKRNSLLTPDGLTVVGPANGTKFTYVFKRKSDKRTKAA
jgi:hypothetical protein